MKKFLTLTTILFLAFTAKAQLGSVPRYTNKDTTLGSTYFIPVIDSVTKKPYKITPKSLYKSTNVIDTCTGKPASSKIAPNTFKAFRNPATDSIFIWFNWNGTVRKV